MAAAVLATRARGIKDVEIVVSSSGTSSWHVGQGPNPPSKRVWEKAGYTHDHVASQIDQDRIETSDLILVMDSDNHANVIAVADPKDHIKIHHLREFELNSDPIESGREVPDPYGRGDDAFEAVLGMVERSIDGLLIALGVASPSDTSR
jgi:protein-tyrosine phosphatase